MCARVRCGRLFQTIHGALGNHALAVDYYRKDVEFTKSVDGEESTAHVDTLNALAVSGLLVWRLHGRSRI